MDEQQVELDRFARLLIELVRDRAIIACDQLARGTTRGPGGERWRRVVAEESAHDALESLTPEIVDQTLFQLLDAIDNNLLPLLWEAADGSHLTLRELGRWELAGRLAGGEWPRRFSAERFHDYWKDLRLDVEPERP